MSPSCLAFQKPIHQVFHSDSVVVPQNENIGGKHHLFVIVPNAFKRPHFPLKSLLRRHIGCYLKILVLAVFFGHEIDLSISLPANVDLVSATNKLKKDDVFQRESEIIGFTGKYVIPKPKVYDIQFAAGLQKLLTRNVDSPRLDKKRRIL